MADDGTSQGTQMHCGAGQPVFWDCGNDGALEIVCAVVVTFCHPGAVPAAFVVNLCLYCLLLQDLTVRVGQVKMLPMSWKRSYLLRFRRRVHGNCGAS